MKQETIAMCLGCGALALWSIVEMVEFMAEVPANIRRGRWALAGLLVALSGIGVALWVG